MKLASISFLSVFALILVSTLFFSCDPFWVMGYPGGLENVEITIDPEKKEYKANEEISIKINGSLDEKNKTGHIIVSFFTKGSESKLNIKKLDGFTPKESVTTLEYKLSTDEISSFTKEIVFSLEGTDHCMINVNISNDARPSNPYKDCFEQFEFDVVE